MHMEVHDRGEMVKNAPFSLVATQHTSKCHDNTRRKAHRVLTFVTQTENEGCSRALTGQLHNERLGMVQQPPFWDIVHVGVIDDGGKCAASTAYHQSGSEGRKKVWIKASSSPPVYHVMPLLTLATSQFGELLLTIPFYAPYNKRFHQC